MSNVQSLVLTADELTVAAEGRLVGRHSDVAITGFTIDSQRVRAGDLFFAIRGERLDGHRFVAEAIRHGASGAIVSDVSAVPIGASGEPAGITIVVPDTTEALQMIAQFIRRRSGARVVAITGSVGKTTTKELVAAFLETRYRVFRNEGNLNNHIGLPLSLLELRHCPEVAVVELGMNHVGEIRTLVRLAEPEVRVWTNVAEVHAAFFGSIDAIADAKAEILDGATADMHVVANAADHRVMARVAGFVGEVSTFSVDAGADVYATDVRDLGLDGSVLSIRTPVGDGVLHTPLVGEGNVANVLAAIAVALRFQVPLDRILARAATCEPQPHRGEIVRCADGLTIVDDSYNSNPKALECMLRSVGGDKRHQRRVAVLGEMLELGGRTTKLHRVCGRLVVETGFDLLVAVGGTAVEALVAGAREAGLAAAAVTICTTSAEAADITARIVKAGDLVLVKGSRGIRLDLVVDRLAAGEA